MEIISLIDRPELMQPAIQYFWKCWGSASNFKFYEDCILYSVQDKSRLPMFYVLLHEERIVGSYALLTNDIISRQDLMPWLACLYVNEEHRGQGIASQLLQHGLAEANRLGYQQLHLSTDLENFYERKGWLYLTDGYNVMGEAIKIYTCKTAQSSSKSS
ncbi:GNAT family N-acetyltransferase [Pontibacter lucknowensis]|uniref:Acetyltransferase (GNAT) domain-containing protein n=1 Tax=Pontibacter lucknowensis TaxID=1077936 RepID=A0A1N7AUU1_9BACT|nr:GNAT family N-acetyltransferase [Pontibacter lucknowensis]SIR42773.1 Acetyltransferase (GNAT) domain-containing protein [Pontibacter lucknowensis]